MWEEKKYGSEERRPIYRWKATVECGGKQYIFTAIADSMSHMLELTMKAYGFRYTTIGIVREGQA